jgi:hypothetical protein
MPTPKEHALMDRLYVETHFRHRLKPWETVRSFQITDKSIAVTIETYEVKILVREDRYERKGIRALMFDRTADGGWKLSMDYTAWDDNFESYVYEKFGRRKTVDEFHAQREWEKLCHRPGTPSNPLDSYSRVLEGYTTDKMERHF